MCVYVGSGQAKLEGHLNTFKKKNYVLIFFLIYFYNPIFMSLHPKPLTQNPEPKPDI